MSDEPVQQEPDAPTAEPGIQLDPVKVQDFRHQLEAGQRLIPAVLAGAIAALVGAGIWAAVTVATHYQIGWMAVGVGALVGLSVRRFGRGLTNTFGIIGAILSLAGCLLGNLLSICGFVSVQESVSLWRLLATLNLELIAVLMKATFSPMDLLFYGIAIYEGYKLSFRRITPQELMSLVLPQAQS